MKCNNFYSIYSTKKSTTKDLKYSAIISLADIQYNSTRTVSSNTATGKYDADGYSAELNAVWNKTVDSKILSPEETKYFIWSICPMNVLITIDQLSVFIWTWNILK